jgi:hypothetical protein
MTSILNLKSDGSESPLKRRSSTLPIVDVADEDLCFVIIHHSKSELKADENLLKLMICNDLSL